MAVNRITQIRDLLKSIETGDPGPIAVVNEAKYIQHNPQTHEGSEGLATLFARLARTEPRVNLVRGFEDGDYVFAHMEYDFSSRKICFEVFRFEDGQAVEHWDNIQDRLGPNASDRSMVDGATEVADLDQTEANRTLVHSFVRDVLIGGAHERLTEFMRDDYAEHNPHLGDGIAAVGAALSENREGRPRIAYGKLHRVLAQGNFVLTVTEGEKDGTHTSFYDLFRIEAGKIAEHWDTTERVAPKDEWKNTNGKF